MNYLLVLRSIDDKDGNIDALQDGAGSVNGDDECAAGLEKSIESPQTRAQ